MPTWLPKSAWARKGAVTVSAKIRQRRSKRSKPARKGETVIRKLQKSTFESGSKSVGCGEGREEASAFPISRNQP